VVDYDVLLNNIWCLIALHLMASVDWNTDARQYSVLAPAWTELVVVVVLVIQVV
jgi:hypothetical protein